MLNIHLELNNYGVMIYAFRIAGGSWNYRHIVSLLPTWKPKRQNTFKDRDNVNFVEDEFGEDRNYTIDSKK